MMIHRAILGSVERMFAILLENSNGLWPFFLSPRQVAVLPVSESHSDAAQTIASILKQKGIRAFFVNDTETLPKRVRTALFVNNYNYVAVIGDKEVASSTLSVRSKKAEKSDIMKTDQFVDKCIELNSLY